MPLPFQSFSATQATNTGEAVETAISPDGKFLLTVQSEKGQESLWLRNIPTGSDTQVVVPSGRIFTTPAFSPDGSYVYFRQAEGRSNTYDLLRAPLLGGAPELIARNVDSNPTFSPDGRNIAYARANNPEAGKWSLFEANADGSNEKVLVIVPVVPGGNSPLWLAWSPDGERIAVSFFSGFAMFDLASGKMNPFVPGFHGTFPFALRMAWAPDGRSIYFEYPFGGKPRLPRAQIGEVTFPEGKFQSITNDANRYDTLSVSADGKTLAMVQYVSAHEIDVLPASGAGPVSIVPGIPSQTLLPSFDWTPDGQLLVSEGNRLMRMRADGTGAVPLLSDSGAWINNVISCSDSRTIAVNWGEHGGLRGRRVWRANADGSNPVALSNSIGPIFGCSPDSNWLYSVTGNAGLKVRRVPVAGGKPEAVPGIDIPHHLFQGRTFSPDGRTLALFVGEEDPESHAYTAKIALVTPDSQRKSAVRWITTDPRCTVGTRTEGGPEVRNSIHFTPDGKAVALLIEDKGVDNVWVQPLDGSKGRQITHFDSDYIRDFRWSPDGKRLALLRWNPTGDVILLHDTTSAQ